MNASERFDVAIVGAGPAGSSLAIRLASSGIKVVMVERHQFPREKLCGEFISPECGTHLAELAVLESISEVGAAITKTVFYAASGRRAEVPSEWFGGTAIGLSRRRMDELLLRRAEVCGVKIISPAMVTGVTRSAGVVSGVTLAGSPGHSIEAKLTVDATGRTRQLSGKVRKRTGTQAARQVAFKAHFTDTQLEPNSCEIYSYPGGYGGCNNVENGLANLCFIVGSDYVKRMSGDPLSIAKDLVFRNERAKQALKGMKIAGEWLAVPVDRYGRGEPAPEPGLISVGDAAHFIDPFTGSGILTAFESSRLAATAILSAERSEVDVIARNYTIAHAAAFNNRLRFSSYLRRAAFSGPAANAMVALLNLSTNLSRRIALATRF